MSDVNVINHGSLFTFHLQNDQARDWVEEHVEIEEYMRIGESAFACEHRFAEDIVEGMISAGLEVVNNGQSRSSL